jgi:hypothetical protein
MSTTSEQSVELVEVDGLNFDGVESREQSAQINGNMDLGYKTYHDYINVTSLDHSSQHNGNVGDSGYHTYQNVASTGTSQQVNGNVGGKSAKVVRTKVLERKIVPANRMAPKKVPAKYVS